ncbi:MAG: HD domain-containing protein [Bacteroidetes bacterium]|nr:HD domain-containing protein [Bacteroidota bacterium]
MFIKKQIIFNDPIYGFITVPDSLILQIINHPYFLRLQRIRQLGLTSLVYPGALHTRFQHAMGAMHLTMKAVETLRSKEIDITEDEERGVLIAVLLHDIGHGPFSHALEHSIVDDISHEDISELFLEKLDKEFKGQLSLARKIFSGSYKKKFLHQLVSGQLDMDRLDYLNRDSFFTGVSEGVISSDRIIKMLNVMDDELVVDAKGIYSVEKFIIARRLMYWQVYLHKTVLSAEFLLVKILQRAKEIAGNQLSVIGKRSNAKTKNRLPITDYRLFCTPALETFLYSSIGKQNILSHLDDFALLDDSDIFVCVKAWMKSDDFILSTLCTNLVNRKLYKVIMQNDSFDEKVVDDLKKKVQKKYKLSATEADYLVFSQAVSNDAYRPDKIRINILYKDGKIADIAQASDQAYLAGLKTVKKYFLCFPKEIV